MAEIDRIKVKIFNLLNKTVEKGCTEAEALAAARKAGELMDHYNLSITDIQIKQTNCKLVSIEIDGVNRGPLDGCLPGIAYFCDCKVWFSKGYKRAYMKPASYSSYKIFGLEPDTMMAEYLYKVIKCALDNAYAEFRKSDIYLNSVSRKRATASFRRGFSNRISNRLFEMKKERDIELHNMQNREERTGRNLVLVKQAKVEEDFNELGVKLTRGPRYMSNNNYSAYRSGSNAASKVNLSKAISGNGAIGLLS